MNLDLHIRHTYEHDYVVQVTVSDNFDLAAAAPTELLDLARNGDFRVLSAGVPHQVARELVNATTAPARSL